MNLTSDPHLGSSNRRKYAEVDSLFFKLQGPTQRSLEETSSIVKKICRKYGGTGYSVARNAEESEG
jgi:D-lactate dehydrogenase (cytochrome)